MPYMAPFFKHDIFVSYAHGRVKDVPNPLLRTWTQAFIDILKPYFTGAPTEFDDLDIWDDRKFDTLDKLL